MSQAKIPLYPTSLFGFYLQLTALGLAVSDQQRLVAMMKDGEIVVSARDYVDLLKNAVENVVYLKTGEHKSYEEILKKVDDICREVTTPLLYRAGRGDRNILKDAFEKESWCEAALMYVSRVINEGGPLGGSCDSLALFKATVYSTEEFRGAMARGIADDINSVGLGLVGGLASFMGAVRIRDSRYEYFIAPDGSYQSIVDTRGVLEAMYGKPIGIGDYIGKLSVLVNLEGGISIDFATFFTAILQVSSAIEKKEALTSYVEGMSFDRYLLIRNVVSQRPQIMWASPMNISQIVDIVSKKQAVQFLSGLYRMATGRLKDELLRRQVASAVGGCVNSAMLYFWSGQKDFLLNCARDLVLLSDRAPKDLSDAIGVVLSGVGRMLRKD